MIIAEIVGGLANQMVIYAAARSLSLRKQTELKLDLDTLRKDALRTYQLHHLNIKADIATPEEVAHVRRSSKFFVIEKLKSKIRKKLRLSVPYIYQEPLCQFDENFWALPSEAYIGGNFISTKYFKDIAPVLRNEFAVKSPLSDQTEQLCNQLENSNSVSIHVRRGDYASNPHTNACHGLISVEYYARAIEYIQSRTSRPVFYLFSDDMSWAKEHVGALVDVVCIEHNSTENAYEDLHLMKLCRHNIVANSGFSYWAAWLNETPDKIVVAPKVWCADNKLNALFDLIPEEWYRI